MTIELMKDKLLNYKEEKYYFSKFDFGLNTVEYKITSVKGSSDVASKTIPIDDIDYFFIYRTNVIERYQNKRRISETGAAAGTNMKAIYKTLYRFSMFVNKIEYSLDEVMSGDLPLLRGRTANLIKTSKKRTYYKFDKSVFVDLSKNTIKNDPYYLHNLLFRDEKTISYRDSNELDLPYYKLINKRNEILTFTDNDDIQIKQGNPTTINFKRDYYSSKTGGKSIRMKIYNILTWAIALSLGYYSTRLIHLEDFVASLAIAFGVTAVSYMIIFIGLIQTRLSKKLITARFIIDDWNIKYNEESKESIEESMDINDIMEIVTVDDDFVNFFLKDRVFSVLFSNKISTKLTEALAFACSKHFR